MIFDLLWREPFIRQCFPGIQTAHHVKVPFSLTYIPADWARVLPTMPQTDDIDLIKVRMPYPALAMSDTQSCGVYVRSVTTGAIEDWAGVWFYESGARWLVFRGRLDFDGGTYTSWHPSEAELIQSFGRHPHTDAYLTWLRSYPENTLGDVIELRIATIMIANALLGLKNVVLEEVQPSRRAALRRGDQPPFRYHVLRVEPLRNIKRRLTNANAPAYHLPLHWIRGHVKEFTAERPLFGRHVGRYWWEPTLHGRDKTRFVAKDYEVVPLKARRPADFIKHVVAPAPHA